MWQTSGPTPPDPYRCVECDAVIADAALAEPVERLVGRSGGPAHRVVTVGGREVHRCVSPFLVMSDPVTVPIDAGIAWEHIAHARALLTDATGCTPDEALRAIKKCAADRGDRIGTFAAGLMGEGSWRSPEGSHP